MQPTKLFPGLRAAILTFQIHKLWRRFLRIVTSKDKDPFLMTPVNYWKTNNSKFFLFDVKFLERLQNRDEVHIEINKDPV